MANVIDEGETRFSNPDDFDSQIKEFIKVKNSLEILEARSKELREKLFAHLELEGEVDDKGNYFIEFPSPVDGVSKLEKARRATRKIDETVAEKVIKTHKLEDTLYKYVQTVDEDALMGAFYEGKITEDELDEMFPAKITWALMTKKVK